MRGLATALGILFIVSMLAGCLGGDEQEPAPMEPEPEAPAPPNPEWGTLAFTASGQAGDWILVHQPLPPNVTTADHAITGSIALEGDGLALIVPPDLAFDHPERINFLHFSPRLVTTPATVPFDVHGATAWHETMTGFVFGVGATVPWTLDVNIDLGNDGPPSETALVARGNGTIGTTALATAGTGAPAGEVSVSLTTDGGGWTHLALVLDRIQPSGVHQVDASFASGHTLSRQGAAARVTTPDDTQGVATGYFTDIGTRLNLPGENTLSATFADLATHAMAAAIHLPGADTWRPDGLAATTYEFGH